MHEEIIPCKKCDKPMALIADVAQCVNEDCPEYHKAYTAIFKANHDSLVLTPIESNG